jgi:hypothetical protein
MKPGALLRVTDAEGNPCYLAPERITGFSIADEDGAKGVIMMDMGNLLVKEDLADLIARYQQIMTL